jgi:hypothetical protein
MSAELPGIPAQQALAFLREWNKGRQLDQRQLDQRRAYRHAAAVLAGIDDIGSLNPLGPVSPSLSAAEVLRDDLVPVNAKRVGGRVMLSADVRREALAELVGEHGLSAALAANPKERTGPVQAQFENYLMGPVKAIEKQTLPELEDSLQVLLWLDGVPIEHPPLDDVRRRLDYLRLLAPFESLAGDAVFRGRQREMDDLRAYVGVLPPDSLLALIANKALSWIRPTQRPALTVFGPGGVGKSALVARFMLEHTRLPEAVRIPFAYLDFDRPTLDIGRPLTLCVEMIRQLHLQFPIHENVNSLLDLVVKQAAAMADTDQLSAARAALADLLGLIQSMLGLRPYVVTLDTFEEVQYRREASAFPFWDMLTALQQQAPFLRVVISGRAPVESLRLAGKPADSLEIGSLDHTAAIAFLRAQGIDNDDIAARIVNQVGGVPLSLKLAASLIKRIGADARNIDNLTDRSSFWFSASDELIQGQLFERILGHIHNPQVERLAHPGLVLRRITPEVILNVLNEPCSLAITSLTEAEALFEKLRKETALVMINQDEGAEELVHRSDLRRIMLKLLVQKAPAQVRDIHKRAVDWYKTRPGLRARAEELYHRLQLGEGIWQPNTKNPLDDRSIRFSIQTSLEELPIESQLLLAGYGFRVPKEILARADRDEREAGMVAEIEELLPYGPTSVEQAAAIARELLSQANGASPAYRAAARVAFQQGNVAQGLRVVERGLSLTIPANNTIQTLELLREKAWALLGEPEEKLVLGQLNEYARRHQNKSAILQQRSQSAWRVRDQPGERETASALAEIAGLLPDMTTGQIWELVPVLGLMVRGLVTFYPEVADLLGSRVTDEKSPFQLASFADSRVQQALQMLVNDVTDAWGSEALVSDLGLRMVVAERFEQLCAVWPYRVLQVQPPYGSRGSQDLREVAA